MEKQKTLGFEPKRYGEGFKITRRPGALDAAYERMRRLMDDQIIILESPIMWPSNKAPLFGPEDSSHHYMRLKSLPGFGEGGDYAPLDNVTICRIPGMDVYEIEYKKNKVKISGLKLQEFRLMCEENLGRRLDRGEFMWELVDALF